MHATLVQLATKPGMREKMEKVADQMLPVLRGLKGFKNALFMTDYEADEYFGVAVWESKEDAEAAFAATDPRLEEAVGDIVKEPPISRVFELYEPKT